MTPNLCAAHAAGTASRIWAAVFFVSTWISMSSSDVEHTRPSAALSRFAAPRATRGARRIRCEDGRAAGGGADPRRAAGGRDARSPAMKIGRALGGLVATVLAAAVVAW